MKRLITALSFSVLAAPAFAVDGSLPFEQTQFDRQLANVKAVASPIRTEAASTSAPFEKTQFDRALPSLPGTNTLVAELTGAGNTVSDRAIATAVSEPSAGSVWANDHNFIAPAK